MVQSINLAGIKWLFKGFNDPNLFKPKLVVRNVTDIDFSELSKRGIRVCIFDKDNCISEPYADRIHPPFLESIDNCVTVFGHSSVFILSNNIGMLNEDPNMIKALKWEKEQGINVIRHVSKKPACGEEVMKFLKDGNYVSNSNEIAVIGDRILTDIVMANKYGMYSIWTRDTISLKNDNNMAICVRFMENFFYDLILKRNNE